MYEEKKLIERNNDEKYRIKNVNDIEDLKWGNMWECENGSLCWYYVLLFNIKNGEIGWGNWFWNV